MNKYDYALLKSKQKRNKLRQKQQSFIQKKSKQLQPSN